MTPDTLPRRAAVDPQDWSYDRHEQFYMPERDLAYLIRALQGDPPASDREREAREVLRNGLYYQLTGTEFHNRDSGGDE